MTIAVGSTSNTPTYGTRTSSVITAPSSIANGNLLVAVLHVGNASMTPATVTPPTGFTEAAGSPTSWSKSDPYSVAMHVFTKVAASEAGNYTFTHTSGETEGFMYRLTGADATTPVDVALVKAFANGSSNGQTTSFSTMTTVTNGAFVIMAESDWDGPGSGAVTGTTPTIVARRVGSISWIGDGTQTTAGATGARTRTNGNAGGGTPWASLVIAIRPSVGPAAYTMPAVNGTLTEAGQVARLARSRLFPAVNGTLTLAGPTVNLIYSGAGSKSMPGGIGFPTLSGQAATLRRTRVMPAVQGTLTLSGQTAGLRGSRKTAGGVGILTLGGQANRLAYAQKQAAGKGQLTLAGPVVNLIYSGSGAKVLPAGLGFPLLGGQQAILRYARKMAASRGTLLTSGQAATLTYVAFEGDIVMPVSAGVLMMAGREASLNVRRAAQEVGKLEFGRKVYLRRW